MYWEGKMRGYAKAAVRPDAGAFADERCGMFLRLETRRDLFTGLDYLEAVDEKGRRGRIRIVDSQEILARTSETRRYRCYYVRKAEPGFVLLVFCAGVERADEEAAAAVFRMPE